MFFVFTKKKNNSLPRAASAPFTWPDTHCISLQRNGNGPHINANKLPKCILN